MGVKAKSVAPKANLVNCDVSANKQFKRSLLIIQL